MTILPNSESPPRQLDSEDRWKFFVERSPTVFEENLISRKKFRSTAYPSEPGLTTDVEFEGCLGTTSANVP